MSAKDRAMLNYLLTLYRNECEKLLLEEGITPEIEEFYEEKIKEINDLMSFSIVEGE